MMVSNKINFRRPSLKNFRTVTDRLWLDGACQLHDILHVLMTA